VFQPKPITADAIAGALAKAERYRLLNEPEAADSICLDILDIDPENQDALVTLLLARTDLIARGVGGAMGDARAVLQQLKEPYDREYYAGIISERRGHAQLLSPSLGATYVAYDWFREAMICYERAMELRPTGNDDAVLRWNSCARVLNAHPEIAPREPEEEHTVVLDD